VLHNVPTGSGTHPAAFSMMHENHLLPAVNRSRREARNSPPSSSEVECSSVVMAREEQLDILPSQSHGV
jgi:hypothetical protein